ncbi:hypothetical protein Lupro_11060 [Lutibacter profundi]|uniref:Uncharacterized protein n=1 Tax=Lutibacter profundi TaxID=1622118 RepID=A0A0X8G862_9FLAO|nr:DUF6660 family protein [Lutibacter profundi]AMC11774.1 hypothetical protein Lupro_11060 [Lutibacter profundi]
MKLIVIILSIYTVVLTAIPCDDVFINDKQQEMSISQSSDDVNHNTFDLCSPFCSCVCCASFFTEQPIYDEVLQTKIAVKELCTFSNTSFANNYFSKIYQPPRV